MVYLLSPRYEPSSFTPDFEQGPLSFDTDDYPARNVDANLLNGEGELVPRNLLLDSISVVCNSTMPDIFELGGYFYFFSERARIAINNYALGCAVFTEISFSNSGSGACADSYFYFHATKLDQRLDFDRTYTSPNGKVDGLDNMFSSTILKEKWIAKRPSQTTPPIWREAGLAKEGKYYNVFKHLIFMSNDCFEYLNRLFPEQLRSDSIREA